MCQSVSCLSAPVWWLASLLSTCPLARCHCPHSANIFLSVQLYRPPVKSHCWCELCMQRGWPCNVTLPSPFRPPLWVTPTALTGQLLSSRLWSFLVKLTLLLSWFISVGHTSKQSWWWKPLQVFVSSLSSDPACCQWAGLADPVDVLTRENTICPHIGSQRKTSPVWDARPDSAADPMRDKIYMKKSFQGKAQIQLVQVVEGNL